MKWKLNGKDCDEIPGEAIGFVYNITYTDGDYYVGKKLARSVRKIMLGKKELAARPTKRHKNYKMVLKEHPWRDYEGSTVHSEGKTIAKKEIVAWCHTKVAMAYVETSLQITMGVLFDPKALNQNVGGKYFDNVLEKEVFNEDFYKVTEEK